MADQPNNDVPQQVNSTTDPSLLPFVEAVEKDLYLEIMKNIQENQMTVEAAQKLAQEFLALLPIHDKHELLEKLQPLGQTYMEVRRVYNKYITTVEEEKRQQVLNQMRDHIQSGDLEKAITIAKQAYATK